MILACLIMVSARFVLRNTLEKLIGIDDLI